MILRLQICRARNPGIGLVPMTWDRGMLPLDDKMGPEGFDPREIGSSQRLF